MFPETEYGCPKAGVQLEEADYLACFWGQGGCRKRFRLGPERAPAPLPSLTSAFRRIFHALMCASKPRVSEPHLIPLTMA